MLHHFKVLLSLDHYFRIKGFMNFIFMCVLFSMDIFFTGHGKFK